VSVRLFGQTQQPPPPQAPEPECPVQAYMDQEQNYMMKQDAVSMSWFEWAVGVINDKKEVWFVTGGVVVTSVFVYCAYRIIRQWVIKWDRQRALINQLKPETAELCVLRKKR
jgi:hypothetical protein